jgi:hypothetical protein
MVRRRMMYITIVSHLLANPDSLSGVYFTSTSVHLTAVEIMLHKLPFLQQPFEQATR